ncbi:MAG TPA: FHA domain-containing protein, partial [bacterium]|nr:FHA domain-containing protein [bacterium]
MDNLDQVRETFIRSLQPKEIESPDKKKISGYALPDEQAVRSWVELLGGVSVIIYRADGENPGIFATRQVDSHNLDKFLGLVQAGQLRLEQMVALPLPMGEKTKELSSGGDKPKTVRGLAIASTGELTSIINQQGCVHLVILQRDSAGVLEFGTRRVDQDNWFAFEKLVDKGTLKLAEMVVLPKLEQEARAAAGQDHGADTLSFPIDQVVTIGRGEGSTVKLSNTEVSKEHLRAAWNAGQNAWLVTDVGSANGTFQHGQRITAPVSIHEGETVALCLAQARPGEDDTALWFRVREGKLEVKALTALEKCKLTPEVLAMGAIVESYRQTARRFPQTDTVRIGRGDDCSLQLQNSRVSRIHASARWNNDTQAWIIGDTGSSNGTSIDGEKLAGTYALQEGELVDVRFGGSKPGEGIAVRFRVTNGELQAEQLNYDRAADAVPVVGRSFDQRKISKLEDVKPQAMVLYASFDGWQIGQVSDVSSNEISVIDSQGETNTFDFNPGTIDHTLMLLERRELHPGTQIESADQLKTLGMPEPLAGYLADHYRGSRVGDVTSVALPVTELGDEYFESLRLMPRLDLLQIDQAETISSTVLDFLSRRDLVLFAPRLWELPASFFRAGTRKQIRCDALFAPVPLRDIAGDLEIIGLGAPVRVRAEGQVLPPFDQGDWQLSAGQMENILGTWGSKSEEYSAGKEKHGVTVTRTVGGTGNSGTYQLSWGPAGDVRPEEIELDTSTPLGIVAFEGGPVVYLDITGEYVRFTVCEPYRVPAGEQMPANIPGLSLDTLDAHTFDASQNPEAVAAALNCSVGLAEALVRSSVTDPQTGESSYTYRITGITRLAPRITELTAGDGAVLKRMTALKEITLAQLDFSRTETCSVFATWIREAG